jgi:hypothetical protein
MNTTIGVFSNHILAGNALRDLKAFGVPDNDLSYVYTNENGIIKDKQTGEKVTSATATGLAAGAIIGGIAGLAVVEGILPGMGTLFVAGPLAAILGFTSTTAAGVATGAVAGGIIGALTNLGVDKTDAALYEKHIQNGDVIVIARSTPMSTKAIFETAGAIEVRQYVVTS